MSETGLDQRVARLERNNRRLRWVVIVFGLLLVYSLARGTWIPIYAMKFKYVLTENLSVFDENDRLAGAFYGQSNKLTFFDENGVSRMRLFGSGESPGMQLYGADSEPRAFVDLEHDQPRVTLTDGAFTRLRLSLSESNPSVELFGARGGVLRLKFNADGEPVVDVTDQSGKPTTRPVAR